VVVAKADHRRHGKAQHLLGRAAPDATQHGQQIPLLECRAKAMRAQKVRERLAQRVAVLRRGHCGAQAVEAQNLAQHGPKAWPQQVGPLRKNGLQVGAAPFQRAAPARAGARHLHRKRHVGARSRNVQRAQQGDQPRVGALVEHQKPRVHPVGHRLAPGVGEAHVHGVRVTAKVIRRLEQRHAGVLPQHVGRGQARNAGTDDGDAHVVSLGQKPNVQEVDRRRLARIVLDKNLFVMDNKGKCDFCPW
jgi:hypothetical protein